VIDVDALRERVLYTKAALAEAAPAAPPELLVAGKYVAAEEITALEAAGITLIGENRLQDLSAKHALADGVTYDFIGHLQRRKVKEVLPLVRLVHSVDSERLAREIANRSEGETRILVEVNVAEEETKGGIVPGRLDEFVERVSELQKIVIGGLMAMPPFSDAPEKSRPYFVALRELRDRLQQRYDGRHDVRELSMGTSQDHIVAAQEGATIVRIGRGLVEPARVGA
jgi:pyridoxal phosphate enzyme (YggS family)